MSVLYITQQGVMLHKSGERLVVKKGDEVLESMPAIHVEQVVIFGNSHITTPAVGYLLDKGIDVAFLSSRGRYRGRLQPEYTKDSRLRQCQYRAASQPQQCLELSRSFIRGKMTNALRFCSRQQTRNEEVQSAIDAIRRTIAQLERVKSIESLRGYEGTAAAAFYKAFRHFLKSDWEFSARQFRPPPDPVNAMLSLGYSLLHNQVYAFINVVGLDPYCGFFHQPTHGHATLASDLMEEFRTVIVDRYVLSLLSRERMRPEDFQHGKAGVRSTKEALDRFLTGYYGRLQWTFAHPKLQEKTSYLRSIELQVRHLVRVVLGEDAVYEPFLLYV